MALVDERTLILKAGDGGDGVVRFRHEKFREFGGPAGGDGGGGGNVYALAVSDITYLAKYQERETFSAGRGQDGRSKSEHGKRGNDIEIRLPVGAVIVRTDTGETWELLKEGERVLLLTGGAGGCGNEQFKSSTHQAPRHAEQGSRGQAGVFRVTLKLIADAGLVGLPNAGKSSLLNALTRAHAKVGNYPFTTLEPNLGAFGPYILADIPGLIGGASSGKGLGVKFLKHITRTRVLVHCISCEEDVVRAYDIVRKELAAFDSHLVSLPEYVVLTKADQCSVDKLTECIDLLKTHTKKSIDTVTILDDAVVTAFAARFQTFLAAHAHSATMANARVKL